MIKIKRSRKFYAYLYIFVFNQKSLKRNKYFSSIHLIHRRVQYFIITFHLRVYIIYIYTVHRHNTVGFEMEFYGRAINEMCSKAETLKRH